MDLGTLTPLWRAALSVDHAERTVESYVDQVRTFVGRLPQRASVEAITVAAIEAHKQRLRQRCNPKTVNLALTAIRSFVRYQIASDLRSDDPTLRVAFLQTGRPLPRALSDDQVRALLAALRVPDGLYPAPLYQWRRNRRLIYVLLYTGLRISEARDLRWRDVLLGQRKLIVRGGKGDKDRAIPLHVKVCDELALVERRFDADAVCGHPTGEALSGKSVHHIFERWVPRLRLGFHFTAHQLRHTLITKVIDRGANIFEAQELAGHESPETTRIYYKLSAEHLRSAIDRVEW